MEFRGLWDKLHNPDFKLRAPMVDTLFNTPKQ